MAEYNAINSEQNNALVEGTEGNDSIKVYGNHSTVQAMGGTDIISVNGGRHDNGIWLEGDEENFIYAGAGNDSIKVQSRGASIYGEGGNDTINIQEDHTFADGGEGGDLFYLKGYYGKFSNVTITGGSGKDTVEIDPYYTNYSTNIIMTDFSNDDVLRIDSSEEYNSPDSSYYRSNRVITQSVQNGNVVISDNSSVYSYYGDTTKQAVNPTFSITLQGVSDISQVANAKYYRYSASEPRDYKTFAELFGVSAASTNTTPAETVKPVVKEDEDTTTTTSTTTTEETTSSSTTTTTTTTEVATSTKTTTTTTTDTLPTATGSEDSTQSSNGTTVINNINNYYGDYTDNSNNNGTIVQGSTVNGSVTNNTTVDNSKTIVISGNTYTYDGGDKVIENYQQGEVVDLASDYAGIDLKENSFYVKSSSGSLEIQNSRDKFVGYSAQSQMVAYSYVAGSSGQVDGRAYDKAEIMIGADNADNQIYAGNAGSSLWGGVGGNDVMTGGTGYNEFFYAVGGGNDVVQNANDNDLINLASVNLSQIAGVEVNIGQVNINFVDGGNLQVNGGNGVGYQIAEGTFQVDQSTGQWSDKN